MTTLTIVASNDAPVAERIKPRERDGVVQALRAGVVPRTGVQHVQVGRVGEVKEVVRDIDRIANQGSASRAGWDPLGLINDDGRQASMLLQQGPQRIQHFFVGDPIPASWMMRRSLAAVREATLPAA
jgi:hypothetical protein